ncbi:hypothetical protein CB0940_05443 [Cercospora beticola]|uniref:BTB domain-containing protein n=1 Tax=Cercospora beticola TaxID=122368 RepID=A0A2G5I196_CERBT|nr:hypothetical protein CB0940_05443 [Cercospora beticola]PIA98282.1 hypothetical protein CB0940_05443 [Cercospora beticola]WPA97989.1 hypothetical protein RHO25_002600 [Cercospora beticola]CAK1359193.1 unnamed protein product [Cercospora beticola]
MAATQDTPKRQREEDVATPPASKRSRYDFVNAVKVVAGSGKKQKIFVLHCEVVCRRSHFLKQKCLELDTKDDADRVIELPVVTPASFKAYAKYLYEEDCELHVSVSSRLIPLSEYKDLFERMRVLGKYWQMGDILQDAVFTNKTIDSLILLMLEVDRAHLAAFAATAGLTVPEFPKLRRLAVDVLAKRVTATDMCCLWRLNRELMWEIQVAMLRLRDSLAEQVPVNPTWLEEHRQKVLEDD